MADRRRTGQQGRLQVAGWPILNFAFFAKFRMGILAANPLPHPNVAEIVRSHPHFCSATLGWGFDLPRLACARGWPTFAILQKQRLMQPASRFSTRDRRPHRSHLTRNAKVGQPPERGYGFNRKPKCTLFESIYCPVITPNRLGVAGRVPWPEAVPAPGASKVLMSPNGLRTKP